MSAKPPVTVRRPVLGIDAEGALWREDEVASEWPLTVYVNGIEFVTIVATPAHVDELAVGYLASEGLLSARAELARLTVRDETLDVDVTIAGLDAEAARAQLFARRLIASCCGKGRAGVYFENDARTVAPVVSERRVTSRDCFEAVAALQSGSRLFRRTGALHNALLLLPQGETIGRADIGRHNALDKLYGHAWLHGLDTGGSVLVLSGRVSSEMLLKAVKLKAPIVVSKSAPTELALAMASELGVTVVGFVRGERLNVYTHPERVELGRREHL